MPEILRLSPSIARILLDRSPAHAWTAHRLGGGVRSEETEATERGKLIETLLTGHGVEALTVVDARDWRTNAAKEQRDAARAEGRLPVLAHRYGEAEEVAAKLGAALKEKGIHFSGQNQVRFEWNSRTAETSGEGVPCSGILDHLILGKECGIIYDIKTTENASPNHIQRTMTQYGYHLQHAAYMEAVLDKHPQLAGRLTMQFLFCEVEPPYSVVVAELAGSMRELGERQWRRAVETWGRCLAANRWPDYGGVCRIEAAPWQISQEDEQLAREASHD